MHRKKDFGAPMQLVSAERADEAELWIMGDICPGGALWGDGSTSSDEAAAALAALPASVSEIAVHVNSYGGDVKEGVAIYNALRSHPAHVTTYCEGMACSIASVVFMAGDRRVMRHASLLMLHNPWMSAQGNARELRRLADELDEVAVLGKKAYLDAEGVALAEGELDAVLDAETWVSAEQALEWGLATEVEEADEGGAPTQGAREAVMAALLRPAPAPCLLEAEPQPCDLTEAAVEAVAARVAQLLREAAPGAPAQPHDPFAAVAAMFARNE